MPADLPIVSFDSQHDWEAWLRDHHTEPTGLWLKIAKKESASASVTYPEALESALCFGWIDGQKKQLDSQFWLQKFTPRGRKSVWSKINTEKATVLIDKGRMHPAGQRQVDLAKGDGRWDAAYSGQRGATIPDDLQQAFTREPNVEAFFKQLNSVNRYAILYRLQTAKKPETRAKRLQQFIDMLREKRTIYP